MIKRWIRNLKFVRSFLIVVRDPTRTEEIFKVITDPRILRPEAWPPLLTRIKESPKAAELLEQRFSREWNLDELLKLPTDSLGYIYAKHMRDNNLDINFYPPVPGESVESYVQMRSRQTHDIWHVMTGFDTSVPGEIGLQAFLQAQMFARSPTVISSMFLLHCLFYDPSILIETTRAFAQGWQMGEAAQPLFGEKFEENWGKNLEQYRRELGLISYAPAHSRYTLPHAQPDSETNPRRDIV
jgi:ubiquinone biosynthesis protein COQ4